MSKPSKLVAAIKGMADGAFDRLARYDSWQNLQTGMGVQGTDKTLAGKVLQPLFLDDSTLSALFHSHDLAERMISIVPQECMREGFAIQTGTPELDAACDDKCTSLDLRQKFAEAGTWARLFGGAAILIGADDGRDASLPLVPERARDVSYTYVIDRRMLWPITWYSEYGHPKFGSPETYMVTTVGGTAFNTATVHESRLIIFRGAPTGVRERTQLFSWDLSYLQRAHDVLRSFDVGWAAVETMLTDGNQAVFKVSGLSEMISAGGESSLLARMRLLNQFRSVYRALVLDSDAQESFERQSVSLTDIPATLEKLMLRLSAAVQIPVTILMGQSPAGMSATGDSDFRWFHAKVRAEQTVALASKIRRIIEVWLRTKTGQALVKGEMPKTLSVHFPPLWTDTPLDQATREKTIADRDAAYIDAGVLDANEVALHRFRPNGFADEIQLSDEGIKAREAALAKALKATSAADESGNATQTSDIEATAKLTLNASDLATIVKVNEARASVGLAPLPGKDGQLTLTEFKAKHSAVLADAAQAEAGDVPSTKAQPDAIPPGGPGLGGPAIDEESDASTHEE